MFNVVDNAAPYTLRMCAGVTEAEGRRAGGFMVESFDEKPCLALPSLIECTEDRKLQEYLSDNECTWVFNPPHLSHMGGSWERMIEVSRQILESMLQGLGPSKLSHKVLTTFMAEVTAIVNARPLVPVSTDPDAPFILTPETLLTQKTSVVPSPSGEFGEKDLFSHQWRQVQSLANTFWHHWRKEYLATSQGRRKWQNESSNLQML